jgi:ferric-dicitrate binding protein FerR (iron transport regulator)
MSNKSLLNENLTNIIAENGQVSKVELSDGSLVWLNSGSEITYSNFYGSKNRNIKLTGEGFFQVSNNEEVPFIVQCDEVSVKVTGTRFNVEAYPEEKSLNVVLEEGAVELLDSEGETLLYKMNPGELVQYNKSDNKFDVTHINTSKFTSWKEGILNIYDQRLEDLVKKLELRFNQKFEVENEVKDFRYTFTIKNETLEEVIDLIQQITPVKIEQENETIIIKLIQRKD